MKKITKKFVVLFYIFITSLFVCTFAMDHQERDSLIESSVKVMMIRPFTIIKLIRGWDHAAYWTEGRLLEVADVMEIQGRDGDNNSGILMGTDPCGGSVVFKMLSGNPIQILMNQYIVFKYGLGSQSASVARTIGFVCSGGPDNLQILEIMEKAPGKQFSAMLVDLDVEAEDKHKASCSIGRSLGELHQLNIEYRSDDPSQWFAILHGDPHPGNVFYDEDEGITWIDVERSAYSTPTPHNNNKKPIEEDVGYMLNLLNRYFSGVNVSDSFIKGYIQSFSVARREVFVRYISKKFSLDLNSIYPNH